MPRQEPIYVRRVVFASLGEALLRHSPTGNVQRGSLGQLNRWRGLIKGWGGSPGCELIFAQDIHFPDLAPAAFLAKVIPPRCSQAKHLALSPVLGNVIRK